MAKKHKLISMDEEIIIAGKHQAVDKDLNFSAYLSDLIIKSLEEENEEQRTN